jgi:DNA-binding PadR family transcriptional regulator
MVEGTRGPDSYLPLTPAVFQICLALVDGEKHGYGIMQEVLRRTDGEVKMGPGTLYGTLKRMLADGLVVEAEARPDPALDDERRRYYRLADLGTRVAAAEAARLDRLVRVARSKHLLAEPTPLGDHQ